MTGARSCKLRQLMIGPWQASRRKRSAATRTACGSTAGSRPITRTLPAQPAREAAAHRAGEGRWRARQGEHAARRRPDRARAAAARLPRPAAPEDRPVEGRPRLPRLHHPLRGRRSHGAQQAARDRRAGRHQDDAPSRPAARRLGRRTGRRGPASCIGSTATRRASSWWPSGARSRRSSAAPSRPARCARSTGRW